MDNKRYFKILVPRGHCGCGQSICLEFFIEAQNMLNAYNIAMRKPGVKHNKFCYKGSEITYQEYCVGRQQSAYDCVRSN